MKLNWAEILEGWRFDLFPPKHLEELIKQTQDERLSTCTYCAFNSTPGKINVLSVCRDCGCPLKKKTACLHCECPKGFWERVIPPEESEKLKNQLNIKQ